MISKFTARWATFLLLTLLTQGSRAATFLVTNTADPGSLRTAVTNSNSAGGTNTISWSTGSGGTITLGSDLPGILNNTTLDVSNAPSAVTIAGSNAIPLAGAVTFNNATSTESWTISAVISSTGSLIETGVSTLTLTGANTYSGGTFLNGGILNINSDNALGAASSTVTFSGGTLQAATNIATSRYYVLNGSGGTFDTNGSSFTLSGVLSGSGTLNVLGTSAGIGFVTLTNANNTYSGGTSVSSATLNITSDAVLGNSSSPLTLNGGTLQSGATISDSRTVTLNTLGGTFDTNGSSTSFSGSIVGAGALTKIGANTLYLSGSNSYSGGTNINAGTINISNNSSLGSGIVTFNGGTLQAGAPTLTSAQAITLNSGGGTIDTAGNNLTLPGVISGVGALTKISTGTLVLTAANTYSGGTTVSGGILNINNDANLGVSTATLTLNGGTLQSANILSSGRSMTLNAGGGSFDTTSGDMTLSGVISGAGSLNKAGLGTLVLSGADAYGGSTTISSGTLQLGANNALPTGTALTTMSGANFDMIGFTQIVGSYVGAGNTKVLLQPGVTNLTVAGNANFTGGTLTVSLKPGLLTKGQSFTPITYGSNTGTFSSIIWPAAFTSSATYHATSLELTTQFVPFANSTANSNQAAIGNALEPVRNSPTGDAATVIGNLYTLSPSQLQVALDQIGPISLASMQAVGLAGSSVQSAAVSQRMASLADGADHGGLSSSILNAPSRRPGDLLAAAGDNDTGSWRSGYGDLRSPWGFFTSAVGTAGRLQEANSPSGLQPGYAFNSGGITGGADYRLSEHFALGASLGYLHGHASIYAPASGTVDNNSARYGIYGTAFDDNWRADLYLGGALDYFSTHRGINFPGVSRTASASPQATEINVHPEASYDFKTPHWGTLSPFAGLDYDRLNVGSFTESGADSLDLSVGSQTPESLESSLGVRYSQKFKEEDSFWMPYASLGWRHQYLNQSRPIQAQLAAGGATQFSVMTGDFAHNGALVGLGFAYNWSGQTTAKIDYLGDFRSHYQDSEFTASVRWKF